MNLHRRLRAPALLLLAALAALLAFASVSSAAQVTVGPPLGEPASLVPCNESTGCGLAMPGAPVSSDATVAPVSGTVVGWSIGGAAAVPGYNLVVLRKNPVGGYTVTAASPLVTPAALPTQSFPSDLPIQAGEVVGLNYPESATIGALESASTVAFFNATMRVGAEATPGNEAPSPDSPAFNATIEFGSSVQPPTPPAPAPAPAPPAPAPPALSIAKTKPLDLKVGKSKTVKIKVSNTGATATAQGTLRVKSAKGVLVKPETQKLPVIAPGASWTVSVRVELTGKAKKKSTLTLTGTAPGLTAKGSLVVKLTE
jgi:CARDB